MARILYLDDEESLVFLVTRMLQLLGHEPAGFTMASEAIAAFRASPESFELVLTDLSMPTMGGMEFAIQILGIDPGTAVAVLTGHANPKDIEAARAAGVLDVISKPGTIQQMEQVLKDLFAKRPGMKKE
jgi:DNA-binding NtrC family response regulator